MFKTHPNNIHGLKAAVKQYGTVWFHGDGNIYHNEGDSDFRKDFSNDATGPHTYRVKFGVGGEKVPDNVEDINKLLMAAKNKEMVDAQKPKEEKNATTFKVEIPEEDETKKEKKSDDKK